MCLASLIGSEVYMMYLAVFICIGVIVFMIVKRKAMARWLLMGLGLLLRVLGWLLVICSGGLVFLGGDALAAASFGITIGGFFLVFSYHPVFESLWKQPAPIISQAGTTQEDVSHMTQQAFLEHMKQRLANIETNSEKRVPDNDSEKPAKA